MTVDQSIRKTKEALLEVLNNSGLTICTMELLMENMLNIIHAQAENTLAKDDIAMLNEQSEPEERREEVGTE
ncbi:MAG: hypothetical protein IJ106_10530 [Parasporobacterium sp.]|nr:hypothetical protein [Parasporobacterium sp.]